MKKLYTLICSIIFFCTIDVSAQTGNMWTEIPYGQNLNCVHADGDYLYFGADFGIVKYNRLTGAKQNLTYFNSLHDFISGSYDVGGNYSYARFPKSITTDTSGNIYVIYEDSLLRYDGFVWQKLDWTYASGFIGFCNDYMNCIDNKIWIYERNNPINFRGVFPVYYYDLTTNTMNNIQASIGSDYLPLTVNNDGTIWADDQNYIAGANNDSAHLVKLDIAGSILADRYVYANFYFSLSYLENFLVEDASGVLYYINSNGDLSVDDGASVANFILPTSPNSFPFQEEFDQNGNLFLLYSTPENFNWGWDSTQLFYFDGTTVTALSDAQVGTPYHKFSGMDFDDDGNLWLSTYEHNDRTVQENVFKKTASNIWSRFYLNDVYLPGSHSRNYYALGSDESGSAYFLQDNAVAIIDSNLNASFVQFYDSLQLPFDYLPEENNSVSPNGTVWFLAQSPMRLYKIQNGISTAYTNFPQAGNYRIVGTGDAQVYLNNDPYWANQYDNRLYSFDGTTWQLLPTSGWPVNSALWNVESYDGINNKLWYSVTDTFTNDVILILWDGLNNTIINSALTPWLHSYARFECDNNGNIWSMNVVAMDSSLTYWDGSNTSYYTPPNGINFDMTAMNFISTDNGHVVLKGNHYDFFNGVPNEILIDFDGTTWDIEEVSDHVNFYQDNNLNYYPTSQCIAANGKYLFELANEIVVYDPNGIPNMPGATYNMVSGNTFYDLNTNNIYDAGDIEAQAILIESDIYNTFSNWYGDYQLHTDTGLQTIQVTNPPYYIATPASYTHDFNDSVGLGINQIDFAFQPVPGIIDLVADASSWGFTPGHYGHYYLNYLNAGTTIQNTTLTLNYDNQLSYTSASVIPTTISGNTLTWNLGLLSPFDQGSIHVWLYVDTALALGTPLNSVMQVTPVANDSTPLNNTVNYSHFVNSGWDPNYKTVSPAGVGAANIIDTAQDLTYTIFFQNTGTDTAFNITVFDTLDSNVDASTFKLIANSHQVQFYFQNPNILKFVFNNILLPDSNVNEPASHGFVKYSIQPKSGTQYGETIENTASIYFDYNSPVLTNTTHNTFGNPLSVFELSNGNQLQLILYPNPNSGEFAVEIASTLSYQNLKLEITDCSGRILKLNSFTSNKTEVDCKNFSAGVYFVKVLSGDKMLGTAKYVLMK